MSAIGNKKPQRFPGTQGNIRGGGDAQGNATLPRQPARRDSRQAGFVHSSDAPHIRLLYARRGDEMPISLCYEASCQRMNNE